MPRVSPIQSNFSAGEVSPLFFGRVDSDRYKTALAKALNYIPTLQGSLRRRSGTAFVAPARPWYEGGDVRFIPFQFSALQAYVVEISSQVAIGGPITFGTPTTFRFYENHAPVLETTKAITGINQGFPMVLTIPSHGYSVGDDIYVVGVGGMTQVNDRFFRVSTVVDANHVQVTSGTTTPVDSSAYSAYTSGGTSARIYTLSAPYDATEIYQISFTQSDDVLYLTHQNYPPQTLSRLGNANWVCQAITFIDGPYLDENTTSTIVSVDQYTGAGVNITASSPIFTPEDIGRLIRIGGNDIVTPLPQNIYWANLTITSFVSSTHVVGSYNIAWPSTLFPSPSSSTFNTVHWRLQAWSANTQSGYISGYPGWGGWPSCVVFHEDRLCFAGSSYEPQKIWGSQTGDYLNFAPDETTDIAIPAGPRTVTDADALDFSLNSNDANQIFWMTSDEQGMLAGSISKEWLITAGSGSALSPTNITIQVATTYGSAQIKPVQMGKATLFVQKSTKKVREMFFFYYLNQFQAQDMTLLSEHISGPGFFQVDYQSDPQTNMWCLRTDGTLACLTYERDVDKIVAGWSEHVVGGYLGAPGNQAAVETISIIPSPDGTTAEVWMSVVRTVNGYPVHYVEYITPDFTDLMEPQDAIFSDCSLTYDQPVVVTGITDANPAVVTAPAHGFTNGQQVKLADLLGSQIIPGAPGMDSLNGNIYTIAGVTTNTFQLVGVDTTGFNSFVPSYTADQAIQLVPTVRVQVSVVGGLWHLIGQTVSLLVDGAPQGPYIVLSDGTVHLDTPGAVITAGLQYNSDFQMLRLEAGAVDGTSMGKTRRTQRVGFMLHRTGGVQFGMDFDNMDQMIFRSPNDPPGLAVPLFTGIISENFPADYDFENQICLRQSQPLPGLILAVMPMIVTQDRR